MELRLYNDGGERQFMQDLQIAILGYQTDSDGHMQRGSEAEPVKQMQCLAAIGRSMGGAIGDVTEKLKKMDSQRMQAMLVSSDIPVPPVDLFETFETMELKDSLWELAFRDMSRYLFQNTWTQRNVNKEGGPIWTQTAEGEPVKGGTLESSYFKAGMAKYGALWEYTREALVYQRLGEIIQSTELFVKNYFDLMADKHYALLKAGCTQSTAWVSSGADQVSNDILTFDQACFTLSENLKNFGVPINAPLLGYYTYSNVARTRIRAIELKLLEPVSGSPLKSMDVGRVRFIPTWNENLIQPTDARDVKIQLVYPKRMIQNAQGTGGMRFSRTDEDITREVYGRSAFIERGAAIFSEMDQMLVNLDHS